MSLITVLVVVMAIFVVVASLCAGAMSVFVRPSSAAFTRSTAVRAALPVAPVLIAGLVCIAVISAAPLDACHCALHDLHHPHFCLAHPLLSQPLLEAAAWLLAAWALLVAPRLVALGRELFASNRWTATVRRISPRWVDGVAVRIVDCADRTAFTIGTLSPVIVVDRKLWDELTDEQRRAVVHHEAAHATRRDGLTVLALRVCAALFPLASARRLVETWRDAAELCCDRHSAETLGDEAAVAEALVAVERVRAKMPGKPAQSYMTGMAMVSRSSTERRVMALLDEAPRRARSSVLANDVLALTLIALAAVTATWFWPGDFIHHGVETLAGALSHLL